MHLRSEKKQPQITTKISLILNGDECTQTADFVPDISAVLLDDAYFDSSRYYYFAISRIFTS